MKTIYRTKSNLFQICFIWATVGIAILVYYLLNPGNDLSWLHYLIGPLIAIFGIGFGLLICWSILGISYELNDCYFIIRRYSSILAEIPIKALSGVSEISDGRFLLYTWVNEEETEVWPILYAQIINKDKVELFNNLKEISKKNIETANKTDFANSASASPQI